MENTLHKINYISNIFKKQIAICNPLIKSMKKLDKKITRKEIMKSARLRKELNHSNVELRILIQSN